MTVIVAEDQLSLAIGRRGQNVKLAARLMGWKLDIISEEESRRREDEKRKLLQLGGMDPLKIARLSRIDIHGLEDLAKAPTEQVAETLEITGEEAERLTSAARESFEAEVIAATGGEDEEAPEESAEEEQPSSEAGPETDSAEEQPEAADAQQDDGEASTAKD